MKVNYKFLALVIFTINLTACSTNERFSSERTNERFSSERPFLIKYVPSGTNRMLYVRYKNEKGQRVERVHKFVSPGIEIINPEIQKNIKAEEKSMEIVLY